MRVLIIIPDEQLRGELAGELARIPSIHLARPLTAFPALDDFLRTIRIQKPDFLILSVEDLPKVEALLASMDECMPGLPIIGAARHIGDELARGLMHLGIRDYLAPPITQDKLRALVGFLQEQLVKHPRPVVRPADLYTFFPARPGVGTTTIALAASCALAEELSVRTLLLDCDLAAGIVSFHLKLGNSGSILDAVNHAENLDEDMWRQMVGKWGKLEVLHAGNLVSPPHVNSASLQRVLSIARALYEAVCVDLGSSLDELSIELMRESQRIFLVTTPEMAPVYLAQARMRSLSALGLADRVSLVLNRKDHWRDHLKPDAVAEVVGIPVAYSIGNDYRTCSDATLTGLPIPSVSGIGQSIINLAQSLRGDAAQKIAPAVHGRKFLEFFHVSSVEDPTTVWRG